MILYVGGKAQGMDELIRERYGEDITYISADAFETDILRFVAKHEASSDRIAELAHEGAGNIAEGEDPDKKLVIASYEVGCGVVPMDPTEEMFRELTGRFQVELAKLAEEVYRVCCGFAEKIK